MRAAPAPLDLREVFAQPWEGEGSVEWRRGLTWLPLPTAFRFRTEIADDDGDSWDVIDTTSFPDGRVQRRRMRAQRLAPDHVKLSADDMPGGADVRVHGHGFEFSPYVIRVPVAGRLRVPVRHLDRVWLTDDDQMLDAIELKLLGVRVARVTIQLRRWARAAS